MSDYWKGKRIVVTGGAGFLGSHPVSLLKLEGAATVSVIDSRRDEKRKHMKIGILASPNVYPVPHNGYSGSEAAAGWVAQALDRAGHRVVLFARTGSSLDGVPTFVFSGIEEEGFADFVASRAGSHTIDAYVDFTHRHQLWEKVPQPVINVIHGTYGHPGVPCRVCTSEAQRDHFLRAGHATPTHPVVTHVPPLSACPFSAVPSDPPFLMFFGCVSHCGSEYKDVGMGIEVARCLGVEYHIIGMPYSNDDEKWLSAVDTQHDFVKVYGEVDIDTKMRLLPRATAKMLVFRQNNVASAVAALEALACGVPLIGNRMACLREIIKSGVNGFFADSVEEAAGAWQQIVRGEIDRADCRKSVMHHAGSLADTYIGLVQRALRETW